MINKKLFLKELSDIISLNDDILSITHVGTFLKKKKFSDIDIVIITKNLNQKIFNEIKKKIKKINLKKYKLKKKIYINDTFGPLKFNTNKNLVVHLMIYSYDDHIKHVVTSPFTCLDWERNKALYGKDLYKILPVSKLFISDFYNNNRSLTTYKQNILNSKINYKKYSSKKNGQLILKNFSKNIKNKDIVELTYHIFKFLCVNYIKFINQKNIYINDTKIIKFLNSLDKYYEETIFKKTYEKLLDYKLNQENTLNIIELKKITLNFINKFDLYLKQQFKNTFKVIFKRHLKTKYKSDIFIGQKINPSIYPKRKYFKKYDISFSSPAKRAIQTAKLYSNKNIINKNLHEINYGSAEGLKYNKLIHLYPQIVNGWKLNKDIKFPRGENNEMVLRRLKKFKTYLAKNINGKKIINKALIVSHNVLLRCLIGDYLKIQKNKWYKIKINYGEEFIFYFNNNKFSLNIKREKLLKNLINVYEDSNSNNIQQYFKS